jgi:integrase
MFGSDGSASKAARHAALYSGASRENSGHGLGEVHREKHLARNRSGKWEVRWTETDERGRARTRSYSTHTDERGIAERVMRAREQDLLRAQLASAGGVSLGVLLDLYRASAVARGVGKTQLVMIETLRGFWGDLVLTDVTPEMVEDYRVSRGVSSSTLRRELNTLIACLNWSARHGKISHVPMIELPPEGAPRAKFLDEALEGELWDVAARHRIRGTGRMSRVGRFILIALDTGARKSAIEGLTWDRVDLARGVIDFRDPGLRVTKKRRVAMPIPDRLLPILVRANAEKISEYVLDIGGSIHDALRTFMAEHGFEETTAHVFKHTRITLLLRAGVSSWDVSALTGTSVGTILSVYGHHVQDERLRAAANRRANTRQDQDAGV